MLHYPPPLINFLVIKNINNYIENRNHKKIVILKIANQHFFRDSFTEQYELLSLPIGYKDNIVFTHPPDTFVPPAPPPRQSSFHQTTLDGHGLQSADTRCLAYSNSTAERASRSGGIDGGRGRSSSVQFARSMTARRKAGSEYGQPPPTVSDDKYTGSMSSDNIAP